MRKLFSELLHNEMSKDERTVLITGDLGYGLWDRIRIDYPDRFYNVGSAEQLMIGTACGFAMEGMKPICYSRNQLLHHLELQHDHRERLSYQVLDFLRNP